MFELKMNEDATRSIRNMWNVFNAISSAYEIPKALEKTPPASIEIWFAPTRQQLGSCCKLIYISGDHSVHLSITFGVDLNKGIGTLLLGDKLTELLGHDCNESAMIEIAKSALNYDRIDFSQKYKIAKSALNYNLIDFSQEYKTPLYVSQAEVIVDITELNEDAKRVISTLMQHTEFLPRVPDKASIPQE
jgi:hypothetical protein